VRTLVITAGEDAEIARQVRAALGLAAGAQDRGATNLRP
jgi:hypothetical protein